MSLKSTIKGWFGEKMTSLCLWAHLDSKTYRRLSDIIIEDSYGTTQIDQLLISPYGIFVIEIKNMKGWIYGSEHQKQWTQTFKTVKYKFQNPLRQNYRHIKALCETLGLEEKHFHSVIFFGPDCEIKTVLPPSVVKGSLKKYIHSFTDIIFSDEACNHMLETLKIIKTIQISSKEHVSNLKKQHEPKEKKREEGECPRCGGQLVARESERGPFIGCDTYPKCRYTDYR